MQITPRETALLAGVGSATVLLTALVFQYFGVAPCDLCILQRWPHLFAGLLGLALGLTRLPLSLSWAGAAAMAANTVIAIYHSGVERHIFEGPDSCTSNGVTDITAGDLLAQIRNAPLIRCDEIAWEMFGITMPNLNVVASLVLCLLWLRAARR